jgi:NTP pyrophosphatase (non-canonical NTP hydrolase)
MSSLFPDLPKPTAPATPALTISVTAVTASMIELRTALASFEAEATQLTDDEAGERLTGLLAIANGANESITNALTERMPHIADPIVREVLALMLMRAEVLHNAQTIAAAFEDGDE